jgi:thiamine-phosphate pyrophosphorylase
LKIQNKRFVYLISPTKIPNNIFFKTLELVLKSKKVSFFQLRLKNERLSKQILISKKIIKICRKYGVKFLVNDNPFLALKVNADGCHLGQKDMSITKAKKILKNKIIGITCHNSIKLAKKALMNGANYVAVGAFYKTKTKKVKFRAKPSILRKIKKLSDNPVVAIGGINEKNYKKLLLNKASFLAISGYIWNNNKYKPYEAIEKLK